MYISKLKVLLGPYNGTFKKTSNQVDAEPSSNKTATPPCKTRKVENQVEAEPSSSKVVMSSCKTKVECNNIINLEKVSTTYVGDKQAIPWQSIGRTTLNIDDRGCIISGDKSNDKHMNFTQMLIKQQFKYLEGLKYPVVLSTLECFSTTTNVLQIMHTREDHWIVASTNRCAEGEINVYDSVYGSVEASTANLIVKLFEKAALMKTCPRQLVTRTVGYLLLQYVLPLYMALTLRA